MNIADQQKKIIEQVVNVFETGKVKGDYGSLVIMSDGPHKVKQITYGRSQTTEYGSLEELIEMYVNSGGQFAAQLKPYPPKIGVTSLINDSTFKQLLKDAGKKDPVMQKVQDEFFDKRYFKPAMAWVTDNGFTLALSALVIYDSFIHSGTVPLFLRKRFPEKSPINGGSEETWIKQYVDTRRQWLATHSNRLLQKTVYRMDCFENEIARGNWDLSKLPIKAHGVDVTG